MLTGNHPGEDMDRSAFIMCLGAYIWESSRKWKMARFFKQKGCAKWRKCMKRLSGVIQSLLFKGVLSFFEDFVRLENSNPKCWVVCVNVSIRESRQRGESGRLTDITWCPSEVCKHAGSTWTDLLVIYYYTFHTFIFEKLKAKVSVTLFHTLV